MECKSREVPVLIVFFNRRNELFELIDCLRFIRPKYLYLSCDGGRDNNEIEQVSKIRKEAIQAINWDCEVFTNFNKHNLGCKFAVSSAVQWFFSQVKEGIILEDDCIPTPSFFEYVSHYLDTYREDKRVATIGGRRECSHHASDDLTFSSKFFCWGWASWSDRITSIDVEFGYQKKLPLSVTKDLNFWELRHVKGIHNLMLDKVVNSWAYSYDLHFRAQRQLHIVPPKNFISNIGIGQGTHDTNVRKDKVAANFEPFFAGTKSEVIKSNAYMEAYFKNTYGIFKTLAFPYASKIKKMKKTIG
ncbi:hypothetical protein [Vibrio campbellii]|uniref:hypothetical protein n=1 Tax=Vibrio campbellii TaxID=680 RepID=UPI003F8312C3